MKLNKKSLPFYAAILQTLLYAFAGWLYFSWTGILIIGAMGTLISFSVAFAASQINDIAKKRKVSAWMFLVLLMSFSPVITGTAMYYALEVITSPFWRIAVSVACGFLPDGSVALAGFIAGGSMIEQEQKQPKAKEAKSKAKDIAPVIALPAFVCATCGFEAKSQKALNGHQLKHKPVAYAVSLVEPVTKEQIK